MSIENFFNHLLQILYADMHQSINTNFAKLIFFLFFIQRQFLLQLWAHFRGKMYIFHKNSTFFLLNYVTVGVD